MDCKHINFHRILALFSVAPIPARNMICPAPREATRLTLIWDKGPLMSLARKEKKKTRHEKKRKKNIKKEIKEKFVIYNVGDCFSLYFISMTLSFSFRSSGQYLVSDAGSPFFFFRLFFFCFDEYSKWLQVFPSS